MFPIEFGNELKAVKQRRYHKRTTQEPRLCKKSSCCRSYHELKNVMRKNNAFQVQSWLVENLKDRAVLYPQQKGVSRHFVSSYAALLAYAPHDLILVPDYRTHRKNRFNLVRRCLWQNTYELFLSIVSSKNLLVHHEGEQKELKYSIHRRK